MRRLLVVLLALVVVPTATTASFSVTLNSTSPQTFTGITLSGVDQIKTLPITITVVGGNAGTGWSVTATAAAPTSAAGTLSPLKVTAVSPASCTPSASCVPATNNVGGLPLTLGSSAVKIFNAAASTGTGTVVLTATVQMTYDAKALPATYTSTLTVAGSTSP
jgi:hypothetical protein